MHGNCSIASFQYGFTKIRWHTTQSLVTKGATQQAVQFQHSVGPSDAPLPPPHTHPPPCFHFWLPARLRGLENSGWTWSRVARSQGSWFQRYQGHRGQFDRLTVCVLRKTQGFWKKRMPMIKGKNHMRSNQGKLRAGHRCEWACRSELHSTPQSLSCVSIKGTHS